MYILVYCIIIRCVSWRPELYDEIAKVIEKKIKGETTGANIHFFFFYKTIMAHCFNLK